MNPISTTARSLLKFEDVHWCVSEKSALKFFKTLRIALKRAEEYSNVGYSDLEKLIEQRNSLSRLRRIARKALRGLERLGATDNDNRLGKNKIYHALKRELERKP